MNDPQEVNERNYTTLKEDPLSLLKLVDKYVKIEIIKNCSFVGFVHSFDPVSHSVILLVPEGDTFKPTLIPGHAILNVIDVLPSTDAIPPRKQPAKISTEDITIKKVKLMTWFKSNLLPATEMEDNIVLGNVIVLPPYNVNDVCTNNPIVAMQIKKLIQSMPNDFKPS